jgi:hypothetical protein
MNKILFLLNTTAIFEHLAGIQKKQLIVIIDAYLFIKRFGGT